MAMRTKRTRKKEIKRGGQEGEDKREQEGDREDK